jgi:ABC-type oligopeptide transport system ATPase subunit
VNLIKKRSIFFCKDCSACFHATFSTNTGITKREKIKKLKQRTVACMQPPQAKLQKTLTTHRMLGVLILKKNTKFGIRKKTLAKGKGLKTLLNLSLSKENLKRNYHINSST